MPPTITLTHEREIAAPADRVWPVVADYGRDVEWRTGVVAMVPIPGGSVAPGTTTAEELRLGGRTYRNDGVVLAVEPGERFEWRTTAGARAEGSRTVTPIGADRCRVELVLRVTPRGAERLMAPVLRRMLGRNLVRDLDRLASLVGAEASTAGVSVPSGRTA